MKRYLLSILLGLFLAAGISIYYVTGTTDQLPEYKLSTVQGNANESGRIVLSGSYEGLMKSEFLTVSKDGSDYKSRQSFYKKNIEDARLGFYQNPDISQMIKEHRNFMRGKGAGESFYKDEEWIIYANYSIKNDNGPKQITLSVDLLDLKSGDVSRYEAIVKDQTAAYAYGNFFISDVQRVDDQIHILTCPTYNSEDAIHDYVIDLHSGKLIRNESLAHGIEPKKDVVLHISSISQEIPSAPGEQVLIRISEEKINSRESNSYSGTMIGEHLIMYSYKTGKLSALPDFLTLGTLEGNLMYRLKDDLLSALRFANQTLTWSRYNLVTGKAEGESKSLTTQQLGADDIRTTLLKDDRIYLVLGRNGTTVAVVVDAKNGNLLYKGEVILEDPTSKDNEDRKKLNLFNIILQ